LLPVSQEKIDLSQSPEAIFKDLLAMGITHLHLTQYSGLNGWMNPKIDEWLRSARSIPELPGVELVMHTLYFSGKGEQAVYRLILNKTAVSEEQSAERENLSQPPEGFRAELLDFSHFLLRWETDETSSYALSVWDPSLQKYRSLGITGRGQSTFPPPYDSSKNHCFRIRKFKGGKWSPASYTAIEEGACQSARPLGTNHDR